MALSALSYSSYSRICIDCANDPNGILHHIGRVSFKDGFMRLVWCNSGVMFAFKGNQLRVALGETQYEAPVYIKITVDETVYKFAVSTGKERLIIEGLDDCDHQVLIERITEGLVPVLLKSITLYGRKPSVRTCRMNTKRRIEFLGDSLTCGYGVLAEPTVAEFNTFEEDSTCTAPYIVGRELKADIRTICLSGKGMVCNCNGERFDHRACDFFKYDDFDGTLHNFALWEPQLLVINIGTNDAWGGASEEEYIDEMRKFVVFVNEVYPKTKILWLCGMLGDKYFASGLSKLIRELGGAKNGYYMLRFDGIENHDGETGGGGHPNVHAQIRFAKALLKQIRLIMGWTRETEKDIKLEVADINNESDLDTDRDAEAGK